MNQRRPQNALLVPGRRSTIGLELDSMNVRTCLVTCLLLGLTTASQAQQQVRADTLSAIANTKVIEPDIPVAQVALGSTIGWALGLLAGVGAGVLIQPNSGDNWLGADEWWIGAWIGSSLGAATGANIANGSRGSLLLGSLATLGITPLAMRIAVPLVAENGLAGGALIPVAQISISVIVERATSRDR
jgi:hypothetical protein